MTLDAPPDDFGPVDVDYGYPPSDDGLDVAPASQATVEKRASRAAASTEATGATGACTDLANAERLVRWHGGDIRFVSAWGRWLAWDGRRWVLEGADALVTRLAIATTRRMLGEAQRARTAAELVMAEGGDAADKAKLQRAESAVAWALKSQDARRINAMISLAKASKRIAIKHDQLDANHCLLNLNNGTLDLVSGKLRPHRRADLCTKLAPVAYDPTATAPTWEAFLDRAMGGNVELVGFLRRCAGYALTGLIREHMLVFFYGEGGNGKSTTLAQFHAMLGDYAAVAPRGLLFTTRNQQHPTELAGLYRARFVTCAEIEEGRTIDEAKVKDLTGGDEISTRRMNEDFWAYKPTHKLFLAGNHKPVVRGTDAGIWRRIRLVPWTVQIPESEQDPALPAKLSAELPGILAWAVRGCAEWQAHGLGDPIEVREATAAFREESDPLGEFFSLRCMFEEDGRVTRKMLRCAYEEFAVENGIKHALDPKRFTEAVRVRGGRDTTVRDMGKPCDGWRGVRLLTDSEREAAARWSGAA